MEAEGRTLALQQESSERCSATARLQLQKGTALEIRLDRALQIPGDSRAASIWFFSANFAGFLCVLCG